MWNLSNCFYKDGKATSATLACGLLIYSGLCEVPEDALQIFAVKRCPPNMRASELRYLYYLAGIIQNPPIYPHYKPVTLVSLIMQPVPLFTKVRWVERKCWNPKQNDRFFFLFRDGCRPYVEVYSENRCVLSTLQDYERMRLYGYAEGKVVIPFPQNLFSFFTTYFTVFTSHKYKCVWRCLYHSLSC